MRLSDCLLQLSRVSNQRYRHRPCKSRPWSAVKYPKKYESAVGKLVYSKYNSQFQAEPCRTDEQRSKVADEIEAMLDADNGAGDCV